MQWDAKLSKPTPITLYCGLLSIYLIMNLVLKGKVNIAAVSFCCSGSAAW
jgi:hypothetical protein